MGWNRVAVVGAGLIKMGELFDQGYEQMAHGAFAAAVSSVDKGFEPRQVEAAIVAKLKEAGGPAELVPGSVDSLDRRRRTRNAPEPPGTPLPARRGEQSKPPLT